MGSTGGFTSRGRRPTGIVNIAKFRGVGLGSENWEQIGNELLKRGVDRDTKKFLRDCGALCKKPLAWMAGAYFALERSHDPEQGGWSYLKNAPRPITAEWVSRQDWLADIGHEYALTTEVVALFLERMIPADLVKQIAFVESMRYFGATLGKNCTLEERGLEIAALLDATFSDEITALLDPLATDKIKTEAMGLALVEAGLLDVAELSRASGVEWTLASAGRFARDLVANTRGAHLTLLVPSVDEPPPEERYLDFTRRMDQLVMRFGRTASSMSDKQLGREARRLGLWLEGDESLMLEAADMFGEFVERADLGALAQSDRQVGVVVRSFVTNRDTVSALDSRTPASTPMIPGDSHPDQLPSLRRDAEIAWKDFNTARPWQQGILPFHIQLDPLIHGVTDIRVLVAGTEPAGIDCEVTVEGEIQYLGFTGKPGCPLDQTSWGELTDRDSQLMALCAMLAVVDLCAREIRLIKGRKGVRKRIRPRPKLPLILIDYPIPGRPIVIAPRVITVHEEPPAPRMPRDPDAHVPGVAKPKRLHYVAAHTRRCCMTPEHQQELLADYAHGVRFIDRLGCEIPITEDGSYTIVRSHKRGKDIEPEVISKRVLTTLTRLIQDQED